jgi:uncharacterized protein YjiS (DUF1127 family)
MRNFMSSFAKIDFAVQHDLPISFSSVLGAEGQQEFEGMREMMKLLEQIALLARRWATYQRVRAELETYTERELNDMGMSRSDITQIALEAASLAQPKAKTEEERRPALLRQRYATEL